MIDVRRAEETVALIQPVIKRVIGAKISDSAWVEDLTQGTVERVVAASPLLEPETMVGYAVVSARNAVAQALRSQSRQEAAYRRSLPTVSTVESTEESLLAAEERRALLAALEDLSEDDRSLLYAHHVEGEDIIDLAQGDGVSPGSLAVRLSRVRARVRLDYLLAYKNIKLPVKSCRPILLACSTADRRRQRALGAAEHLERCEACAEIAPVLLTRDRTMAGFAPIALALTATYNVGNLVRNYPWPTAGAGVAAAGIVAAVAVNGAGPSPAPAPTAAPAAITQTPADACGNQITINSRPVRASDVAVPMSTGDVVEVRAATFYGSESAKGGWVGCGGYRLWVEAPVGTLQPGQKVSFTGVINANRDGYADMMNLRSSTQTQQLNEAGYHGDAAALTIAQ